MTRYVVPACFAASIAAVWLSVATYYRLRKSVTRHYTEPSNVVRLDSRRKAGEHVTVLRSVQR